MLTEGQEKKFAFMKRAFVSGYQFMGLGRDEFARVDK